MAPEAPIEDCWEVLLWIWEQGKQLLQVDLSRIVIGGASAGGHLSSTMINMLLDELNAPKNLKFRLNLMSVPVVDNTAAKPGRGSPTWNNYPSWEENKDAPALPKEKMLWYRNLFIPSPSLSYPPTLVRVCDLDVLRDEGLAFAAKLKKAGVPVKVEVYKGVPHSAIPQAAALAEGARFQDDCIEAVRAALWD